MSEDILLPPSDKVLLACDGLASAIHSFLEFRAPHVSRYYESHDEANKIFNLSVRHVEAVTILARNDLALLPAAYATARAAFETAIKAAWMVNANDPFEREARWLVHLEEEERMCKRIAKEAVTGTSAEDWETRGDAIKNFRNQVSESMPKHIQLLKANPNVKEMSQSIGCEKVYWLYITSSQFVHGGHYAAGTYRKNLGVDKVDGEFINEFDWFFPLQICWLSLFHAGGVFISRISGSKQPFIEETLSNYIQKCISDLGDSGA